jgi:hypothetical protein
VLAYLIAFKRVPFVGNFCPLFANLFKLTVSVNGESRRSVTAGVEPGKSGDTERLARLAGFSLRHSLCLSGCKLSVKPGHFLDSLGEFLLKAVCLVDELLGNAFLALDFRPQFVGADFRRLGCVCLIGGAFRLALGLRADLAGIFEVLVGMPPLDFFSVAGHAGAVSNGAGLLKLLEGN